MAVTDEQLGAFLDGECSEAEAAHIAALLDRDPALAKRLERLTGDSVLLRSAFDTVLTEPVPPALVAAATAPQAVPVIDFTAARQARAEKASATPQLSRQLAMPRWMAPMAIAASIAFGVVIGGVGFRGTGEATSDGMILAGADGPVAGPALAATLAAARSGTTSNVTAAAIKPVLTFRDAEGRLCRQFTLQQPNVGTNGIACREGDSWRLVVLATGEVSVAGDYVTAAGPADGAVAATLDNLIAGEPLDADAEAAALKAER